MVIFDQKWLFFTENCHFWSKNGPFLTREMWKTWIGFNALVITVNFYLEQSSIRFQVKNCLFCSKMIQTEIGYFQSKIGHSWSWMGLFRPGNLLKSDLMKMFHTKMVIFDQNPFATRKGFLIFKNKSNRGMKYFLIFMSHTNDSLQYLWVIKYDSRIMIHGVLFIMKRFFIPSKEGV